LAPAAAARSQCSFGTCCRSFHVLCGRAAGQQLTFRAQDGEPLQFCELHSRPTFEKMVRRAGRQADSRAVAAAVLRMLGGAAPLQGPGCDLALTLALLLDLPCRWRSMSRASGNWSCMGGRRQRRTADCPSPAGRRQAGRSAGGEGGRAGWRSYVLRCLLRRAGQGPTPLILMSIGCLHTYQG
jgi:hypothetical protein